MDDRSNPLARFRAPVEAGAGFRVTREGGLALIKPLTPRAEAWLREHVDIEATWAGPALAVELRYFPALADAIIAAGFLFSATRFQTELPKSRAGLKTLLT